MGKQTIQEVAKILVEKNGLAPKDANRFATEFFNLIMQRLQQGDQVKVKGLGTFKIINVEARESVSVRTGERVVIDSHSKVTFTPDAVMKELVNRPFSQFETVVLNDGVEFADMPDEASEEEQEVVNEGNEPNVANEPNETDEPNETNETNETNEPNEANEPEPEELYEPEEPDEPRPWGRWLALAALVLVLMALSAFGGYEYGRRQQPVAVADTVWVKDTIRVAEQPVDTPDVKAEVKEEVKAEVKEEAKENLKVEVKEKPKAEEQTADRYAAKDERVRLGAYRIVGTAEEITIQPGQTFYSICRAHLGPDMECYIEVYNDLPRNPQIKAGQKLKIPKLELKKRRK